VKNWYFATFSGLLLEIEQSLKEFLTGWSQTTPLFWDMVDHHFGWDDQPIRLQTLSGKRIRPLLTALVAQAVTGRYTHVLPAALGIEIVHNFTLVHDDVMDHSLERRHRPTLWAKWGTAQAINAGDGMYALGMASVLQLLRDTVPAHKVLDSMSLLINACIATVEGQMLDVGFEQQIDVAPDLYLTMIGHKSGALIECSTRMGALLSTDDEQIINAYGQFGRSLGVAFQIWDDYLGIWGEAETTGKSTTSDIEGRKKSYPVLVAFQQSSANSQRDLRAIYQQEKLTLADIARVMEILDEVDAIQHTREMIEVHYRQALEALDSIGIDNQAQHNLRELAAFLIERAY
jgi:geranylgeranyl diphosphate synthase, type I